MADDDSKNDVGTGSSIDTGHAYMIITYILKRKINRIEEDIQWLSEIGSDTETAGRLEYLLDHAMSYFNDIDKSVSWIFKPNRALGGERQIDLIESDEQAERAHKIISNLQHSLI
ncbi:uncharacterized protein FOKN1_0242 [Thiohalobacter thiocyanaticus]|uniref:Antitoxin Xre/MbcA/ParS-like toxin-binding domain-containing protein n=1 Tax=Thiohalobacter thiocyanaticus TaxID=585455 RepID=A0A1Z4VM03_9GAMM|nr:MbcA/ParS/Xre antitoxin family protein [Thiohalobacter thiocyanaticus]BAZ92646.1 uncharacterized protein FOKN1_0242 [Thiohalobacter thiocyanaticus]